MKKSRRQKYSKRGETGLLSAGWVGIMLFFIMGNGAVMAQQYGENPLMDMRISRAALECDATAGTGRLDLYFDVRTTDGSSRLIAQMQNSVVFSPQFAGSVTSVTPIFWHFNDAGYFRFWRWQPADRVLEFQVTISDDTSPNFVGGPDADTWSPVVGFSIFFQMHPDSIASIDWFWDTPDFNVRAAKIPITGETETIHNLELGAPLTFPMQCEADIQVAKSVNPSTIYVNGTSEFTIIVTNNGPYDASGLLIHDTWPSGLGYLNDTASHGSYNPGSGDWDIGSLAKDSTATLTIQFEGLSAGTRTNVAAVNSLEQTDPVSGNNSASRSVTVNPVSDIEVVYKNVDNDTPNQGENIVFSIRARNNGPSAATGVRVTDQLPSGLTYVSHSGAGTYNSTSGVWTIGSLGNGVARTLQITATASGTGLVTNTAEVTAVNEYDPNTANDEKSRDVTITPSADIEVVSKTVDDATPNQGEQIEFTVTVRNNGPSAATGLQVTDQLPSGLAYVSHTGPGTYNSTSGVWNIGSLSVGTSRVLRLTATATGTGSRTNTAAVSGLNQHDPDTSNDQKSTSVTIAASADIEVVSKTVDDATPNQGEQIEFTITVRNNGPSAATGLRVTDLLPSGLTYVSHSGDGTYNSTSGLWTIGSLGVSASRVLRITADADGTGSRTNTASVSNVDQHDPDTSNDQKSRSVTISASADIEVVSKVVDDGTPNQGENVQFTITVRNNGPSAATNVQVTDQLPSGLTYVSDNGGGAYTSSSGVWQIGNMAVNNTQTLNITATAGGTGTVTNTALKTNVTQHDPNTANDQKSRNVTIAASADIEVVSKTVNDATPNQGENVTFTVVVRNNGPSAASGVQVTDLLPSGLAHVSNDGGGAYLPGSGLWTIGNLGVGASRTLHITATAGNTGTLTNTAEVTGVDQHDPDTSNDQKSQSVNVSPSADIEVVSKTVDDATPNQGQQIVYTITVRNNGPSAATGVQVTDILPIGITHVSDDGGGDYQPGSGVWQIGNLANGASDVLHITATAAGLGQVTNTASVTGVNQHDPNTGNDSKSVDVDIAASADIEVVSKAVDDPTPNQGEQIEFTITVRNNGPSAATNVQITDLLPTGLTLVSHDGGTRYTPSTGVWQIGSLPVNNTRVLHITAEASGTGTVTNTAGVTNVTQYDPNTANDQKSRSVTISPSADIEVVSKTVDDPTPNQGEQIEFTITVRNNGPSAATNVQITDLLPTGLTLVSHDGGTRYTPSTGVWQVGSLPVNNTSVLHITAEASGTGTVTNTAGVTNVTQYDPNTANDQKSRSVTISPSADIEVVSKTVDDPTPNQGEQVEFTITVRNNGPSAATGVQVTDQLPAGLTHVSNDGGGAYTVSSGVWNIGNLGVGTSRSLRITAEAGGTGSVTNTASVTAVNQHDPDTGNDQKSVGVTIAASADIEVISKTVDNASPYQNEEVEFTITVRNNGPSAASGVQITDQLPSGLVHVSNDGAGTYTPGSGVWLIGNMAVNATQTLRITARVSTVAQHTNTATVTNVNQFDPNTGNDEKSVHVTVSAAADIEVVTKSVDDASPNQGEQVEFTITVRNNGPSPATGVQVTDNLPTGLVHLSNDGGGAYSPSTGVWQIGGLTTGATRTLHITARADGTGPVTNTASVSNVNEHDPDTGNDEKSVVVTIAASADIEVVSKSVDNATPNQGEQVEFTVTVRNNGPSAATGVVVTDQLPSGLAYVTHTGSGSYTSSSGEWAVGNLAVGASRTLSLIAEAEGTGTVTNTARVTAVTQHDPDTGNDQKSVSVTIAASADIEVVSKTVDNATPYHDDQVEFTITVRNNGPSAAQLVRITDNLPTGLTHISDDGGGAYTPSTGVWVVGNLGVSATRTLHITVRAAEVGQHTNIATVSNVNQHDPNTGNDAKSVQVTVVAAADIELLSKTVDEAAPNQGQQVEYTITVRNNGPSAATGVAVTDPLPAGVSHDSDDGSGAYNAGTGVWQIGNLGVNATRTLHITATAGGTGLQTNTATVTAVNEHDPDTGNDEKSVDITIAASADMEVVSKTVDQNTPNQGEQVVFTITVRNNGPSPATGVLVRDQIPAGLLYVSDDGSGAYSPTTHVWTIGNLAVGASKVLQITAQASGTGIVTNTASVSNVDQYDPDTANDEKSVDANIAASADIEIVSKTVDNNTPYQTESVIYTIVVRNNGPSSATNLTVADPLPAGLVYVSDDGGGSYDSNSGIWQIGSLDVSATATLNITARATGLGEQINTASVDGLDEYDPDNGNDEKSVSLIISPAADMEVVSKTVDHPVANQGEQVVFTITVRNNGPSDATNVRVQDVLPAGLIYESDNGSGSYDAGSGMWTLGNMTSGAEETLQITATVDDEGVHINYARVDHVDQYDPDTDNDEKDASVSVNASADVEMLEKSVDNNAPYQGQQVVFTLVVRNNGPSSATGIVVTDPIPTGLDYVSSDGNYDGGTGEWQVGNLDVGAGAALQITALAVDVGTVTNTAEVTAVIQNDPDPNNNTQAVDVTVGPSADVELVSKTVDVETPNQGEQVVFAVTVRNNGPSTVDNVQVTDVLPAGLTYVSDDAGGAYTSGNGVWDVGALAVGASETLQITVTADGTGLLTNTASVTQAGGPDPDPTNNEKSVDVTIQSSADIEVLSKTVDNPNPNQGEQVVFTITVRNNGPSAANGVEITDLLPGGLVYVSDNGGGLYDHVGGLWQIGTLAVDETVSLEITATTVDVGQITNTARVTAVQEYDPDTGNDEKSVMVDVAASADIEIVSKTVDLSTPNQGENVVFTIRVQNNGPSNATGVVVGDTLPAGLGYVSDDGGGSYDPATGLWSVGDLDNGQQRVLLVTASVDDEGVFINRAILNSVDQHDPDDTNNEKQAGVSVNASADVELIEKTVDNATPYQGEQIVFTITVRNNGPSQASELEVTDVLPSGFTYISSDGNYSDTNVWTIGTLDVGASAVLHLTVEATEAGPFTNFVHITNVAQNDPDATNNEGSVDVTVTPAADIEVVAKTVDRPTPNQGEPVVFTVTVRNNGPSPANGVEITDQLPTGLVHVSDNGSGIYDPGSGVWQVGALAVDETAVLEITAMASGTGQLINTAQVTNVQEHDPESGNDEKSVSVTVSPAADIEVVSKTVDVPTPNQGETVIFTVSVRNNGPSRATGVVIGDTLPAGLGYVSDDGNGAYDHATGRWTIGDLDVGAEVLLTVTAVVNAEGSFVNRAILDHVDQHDPDDSNNEKQAVVSVNASADIQVVSKTADNMTPYQTQHVVFTISVRNNGPSPGNEIRVTDQLPAGMGYVSDNSGGSYDPGTGIWQIGTLDVDETVILEITTEAVSTGPQTNTAQVTNVLENDPDSGNDDESVTVNIAPAVDIEVVSKTVDQPTANQGDDVIFTMTVRNNGPSNATGVVIGDTLPAGLGYVSDNGSGAYDPATGLWTIGNLDVGAEVSLTVTAQVEEDGVFVNRALLNSVDQFDVDDSNDEKQAGVSVNASADVEIVDKTVDNANPHQTEQIVFTITVRNNGPSPASQLEVTDALPAGLAFVSSDGDYDSGTHIWSVGQLDVGATATLRLTVLAVETGLLTNTAEVTSVQQNDPDASNNSASVDVNVVPASDVDIVSKTVDNDRPYQGEDVIFTITVTNHGPSAASNIVVTDTLPSGFTYASDDGNGSYNDATGQWAINSLDVSETVELFITATAAVADTFTNVALVSRLDEFDVDTGNDADSVTVTIQPAADISVEKTVDHPDADQGREVVFTITVTNLGPSAVTGLEVVDLLPAGLGLVTHDGGPAYDAGTGLWSVGSLDSAATAVLHVTAGVDNAGAHTNTARTTAADQHDPNDANNEASAVVDAGASADLEIFKTSNVSELLIDEQMEFLVTLTNHGPETATGIQVTDILPYGVIYTTHAASQGTFNSSGGLWEAGTLAAGDSIYLTITALANVEGVWSNHATVTQMDQNDPNLYNNTEHKTVRIRGAGSILPDVTVQKGADTYQTTVGSPITFTVTVINNGPGEATSVKLADIMHPGFEYVSSAATQGTFEPDSLLWDVGTLPSGQSETLTINVLARRPGVLGNYAKITRVLPGDGDLNNNGAMIYVNVTPGSDPPVDISVIKQVTSVPNPVLVGDQIEFTITVENLSAYPAHDVRVLDRLPVGLDYLLHIPAQYAYNPATGVWAIGTLNAGAGIDLTVRGMLNRAGAIENCSYLLNSSQADPNQDNNSSCVVVDVAENADLELFKSSDYSVIGTGDPVTFRVYVTNHGPKTATGIQVSDQLPPGVSYQSNSVTQGTYHQSSGIWEVGPLAVGDTVRLDLLCTGLVPGTWTNHGIITASDQNDPDESNNTEFKTIRIKQPEAVLPDISVSKTTEHTSVNVGESVTFTVSVSNPGPGTASNVRVVDILNRGFSFTSGQPAAEYDAETGIWSVGTLQEGETKTLTLTTTAAVAGMWANTAQLGRAQPGDANVNNNQSVVFVNVRQTGDVMVDLAVDKQITSSSDNPLVGDQVEFTITVTNLSPAESASDIRIRDRLPVGLDFVSFSPATAAFNHANGLWNVGTLGAGESAQLMITATISDRGSITNCAHVVNSSRRDPDYSNNQSCAQVNIVSASIYIRLYLEGAYRLAVSDPNHADKTVMSTKLRHPVINLGRPMLPVKSPYADSLHRHTGVQDAAQLPENIVDYIYLQFRPAGSPTSPDIMMPNGTDGVSCLLRNDGAVLDLDGSEGVQIPGLPDGNYYLIVEHRNHLKVMTAEPVNTVDMYEYNFGNTPKHYYDFTEGKTQYYTKTLDMQRGCRMGPINGIWVIGAGDGDKAHQVENQDYDYWFFNTSLEPGYYKADYDLGGLVEGYDETIWYDNVLLRSPFSWPDMNP